MDSVGTRRKLLGPIDLGRPTFQGIFRWRHFLKSLVRSIVIVIDSPASNFSGSDTHISLMPLSARRLSKADGIV
jgi:hypothetical protein